MLVRQLESRPRARRTKFLLVLLKPANAKGPLPGIVALHDHSDFKFYGKEKIADGSQGTLPVLSEFRKGPYGGRAYANALAREGYVVLIHDVFLWGSRRFPLETMLEMVLSAPPKPFVTINLPPEETVIVL